MWSPQEGFLGVVPLCLPPITNGVGSLPRSLPPPSRPSLAAPVFEGRSLGLGTKLEGGTRLRTV